VIPVARSHVSLLTAAQKSVGRAAAIDYRYDTAAIPAKAKDFPFFSRPAAQQLSSSCGRDCADGAVGTQTRESGSSLVIPVIAKADRC
jgi:hypothetical protein